MGPRNLRVLTDAVATAWAILMEMEVESVSVYFDILEGRTKSAERGSVMKGTLT